MRHYAIKETGVASEAPMKTFSRLSLLLLVAGMLLGDMVLASVGLVGVCTVAVLHELRQDDSPVPSPTSKFIA